MTNFRTVILVQLKNKQGKLFELKLGLGINICNKLSCLRRHQTARFTAKWLLSQLDSKLLMLGNTMSP